jgi:hypothetical protein
MLNSRSNSGRAFLAALFFWGSAIHAQAYSHVGILLERPAQVQIQTDAGETVIYQLQLQRAMFGGKQIFLYDQHRSMCPPYLGQLASDLTVTLRDQNGQDVTITYKKHVAEGPKVYVRGTCGGKDNLLTEMAITAEDEASVRLQIKPRAK